ncbi:uncharacterized protein [Coffea arabica]|uniref:Uncharacterized protein isoform X1 n=1 Tax=Coffea arabica TaxID=13443 RepID=A0A6P6TTM6_COFAR|nr:uncharacterized protein LOC113703947 isoform X1 [Coffea arabica]
MRKNKQDELWDDSALINAFNDAISKYKKMHIQGSQVSSADGQEHAGRVDEISDDNKVPSNSAAETEENGNVPTVKESSFLESEAPEDHVVSSTGQDIHQEPEGYLNLQTTEHYNQLVNKYYELEDQRQKILQQLNQFGYWNYDSGLTASVSQEPETSTSQAYPTVPSSFCPYGCQSWVAPCTSVPCYFSGGACAGNSCNASAKGATSKNLTSPGETDFVKTAMFAAEQALSSLKAQACTNCDASVNEGKEKQSQKNFCHLEKSTSSETDLTVVLNAWYSAGFYTGKYLTEQSSARHGHG